MYHMYVVTELCLTKFRNKFSKKKLSKSGLYFADVQKEETSDVLKLIREMA